MTTNSFNQYVDMFYRDNQMFPDDLQFQITKLYQTPSKIPEICASYLNSTGSNLALIKHPIEANGLSKQHSHDYFELMYVSRGHCTQTIGNVHCDLSEGDFCLLNPYVSHSIDISSETDYLFNIIIQKSLFKESFLCSLSGNDLISNFFISSLLQASKQQLYLYFPRYEFNNAHVLIQSLIIELLEKKMGYKKAAENYLALVFTELARCMQQKMDADNSTIIGETNLTTILSYINANKNDITLTSVAEKFHYHPKYISSLIKKYTGKSFSQVLQESRMQEVCYYLENTNMSINELAQLMGYYDRSYFNRTFKKIFNMTPQDYRNLYH
jgi:AraC-like DNA-binding protein/quercetin dioxygenase-like cupin family protein